MRLRVEDTEADPQQRLRRMPAEGTLVVEMLVKRRVVGPRVRLQEAPVEGPRVRLQDAIHETVAGPGVRLQEARRTVDTRVDRDAHRVGRAGPHTDFPSHRMSRRGRAFVHFDSPPIRTQSSPNRLRPPASPF